VEVDTINSALDIIDEKFCMYFFDKFCLCFVLLNLSGIYLFREEKCFYKWRNTSIDRSTTTHLFVLSSIVH
jgi:hypothetical protein